MSRKSENNIFVRAAIKNIVARINLAKSSNPTVAFLPRYMFMRPPIRNKIPIMYFKNLTFEYLNKTNVRIAENKETATITVKKRPKTILKHLPFLILYISFH